MGRWIALIVLAVGLPTGCSPEQASAAEGPRSPVERLVVTRGSFQEILILTGELEAVQSDRILVPRTPSWQLPIRWMEQDGVVVTAGQKVVELDNTQFTGDIEQKRLAESSAYNDLMRKRADIAVNLAENEFQLEQARIALEKARIAAAVPEQLRPSREYQEDQLALSRAEAEFAKAEENLATTQRAAEAELKEKRIALDRAREEIATAERAIAALMLEAPRAGIFVVSENRNEGRKFQVGDNVWVGLTVAQIPELDEMRVVARLSDVDDGRIAVGQRAVCTLDTYPDTEFRGRVTEIAPIAQEQGRDSLRRSFKVSILLEDSDAERMRPGMSVKAQVLLDPIEDALLVPRVSLGLGAETPRAFLADGSNVDVRLGPCNAMECVVEEGLEAGARLRSRG